MITYKSFRINTLRMLLFWLSCGFLRAQNPAFFTINDENNLPSNEVYQVIQDHHGFIWIGCDAGLYRYDGFKFRSYRTIQQNGRSITSLQLDRSGRVWCRNFHGQYFRVDADSLKLIHTSVNNSVHTGYGLDQQSNIWIYDDHHLLLFDQEGKKLKRIAFGTANDASLVSDMRWFKGAVYFTHQLKGVFCYRIKENTFHLIDSIKQKNELFKCIFQIENERLFVHREQNEASQIQVNEILGLNLYKRVSYINQDEDLTIHLSKIMGNGQYWVCSTNGIFQTNQHMKLVQDGKHILKGKQVSNVFLDRENNYWVSTLNDGIFVITSTEIQQYTSAFKHLPDDKLSYSIPFKGQRIIGFNSGLIGCITEKGFSELQVKTNSKRIAVRKMLRYGDLLFITHGPLTIFDGKNTRSFELNYIRDFEIVHDTLYFLLSDSFRKLALKDLYANRLDRQKIIRQARGRNLIYISSEKSLYINFISGLERFKDGQFEALKYQNRSIQAVQLLEHQNELWVLTMSSGILLCQQGTFKSLDLKHPLLKVDEIRNLACSKRFLWLSTNNNLLRYDWHQGQWGVFNQLHGIRAAGIRHMNAENGTLWISGGKGLSVIPEDCKWLNETIPLLWLIGMQEGDKAISHDALRNLSYDHQILRFSLKALSYRTQGALRVFYRLTGHDNEWNELNNDQTILRLNHLPPGTYKLEIKATNEHGLSSIVLKLPLKITPPFWQTFWFRSLMVIFLAVMIYLLIKYRVRYVNRKAEQRIRLIRSQLTALKAQMNPHFMFNALNSIQDLIIQQDIRKSNFYLSRFSDLMRKILDASDKEQISLHDEIAILTLYLDLEKLRFGEAFNYEIKLQDPLSADQIKLPSMLIQPFVENALKHGLLHLKGDKWVHISFSQKEEMLSIKVEDNGIGREKAAELKQDYAPSHRSFATLATEKRIDLLQNMDRQHYRLFISDRMVEGVCQGTIVEILIPLSDQTD